MLLEVYGPTKVLSPYVLNIDAINDYNAEGKHFLTIPITALMQSLVLYHMPSTASCMLIRNMWMALVVVYSAACWCSFQTLYETDRLPQLDLHTAPAC